MKVLFTLLSALCITIPALSQQYNTPVSYIEVISTEYDAISQQMWAYTKAAAHKKSARKIEKRRTELTDIIRQAESRIRKMPAYNGSTSLRDSTARALHLSYLVIEEDYAKIVDLEEVAEQSYDLMEAYLLAKRLANEKQSAAHETMYGEYRRFCAANNIRLVKEDEDKIARNLRISGKVFSYYNEIYLIFFKSSKQEAYLTEAVNSMDLNAIVQNQNTLRDFSKEGMAKMMKIKSYDGDGSVKIACQEALKFFIREADQMDNLINYIKKREEFDRIREAVESKKPKNRTQEDIDTYNKSAEDVNSALNLYQESLEKLNKDRTDIYENWNKSSTRFIDKHVP